MNKGHVDYLIFLNVNRYSYTYYHAFSSKSAAVLQDYLAGNQSESLPT